MSYEAYKILHIAGLTAVALGFGGVLLAAGGKDSKPPRFAAVLHGLGLLLLVVAGFGMMARLGHTSWPWPGWIYTKLGVWVVLGALPVLFKRGILPRGLGWLLVIGLVVLAAWLAATKPF